MHARLPDHPASGAHSGVHRNTSFRWRHRLLQWAKDDCPAHLNGITEADETYLLESHKGARQLKRAARITHESVNLSAGIRVKGAFHVQNVNAYHSRLRQWLNKFHGVATRYLPNYLGWRRALDTHRLQTPQALLLAAVGVFPHSTGT